MSKKGYIDSGWHGQPFVGLEGKWWFDINRCYKSPGCEGLFVVQCAMNRYRGKKLICHFIFQRCVPGFPFIHWWWKASCNGGWKYPNNWSGRQSPQHFSSRLLLAHEGTNFSKTNCHKLLSLWIIVLSYACNMLPCFFTTSFVYSHA